jgi:hypothetical protein
VVEGQVLTHTQALKECGGPFPSSPYLVEVVRDFDTFVSLASDWDHLVDRCGTDRLFLSHIWFRTWWEAFGGDKELHVVTVRSAAGQLLAVAPLMRATTSIYGIKADTLHAIYNPHTPRYDFIVGNNQDSALYDAIWAQLTAIDDCDAIVVTQIPEGSRTISCIEKSARRDGWLTGVWTAPVSPFVRLGKDYDAYFNSLAPGCRFNLTKRYARLRKLGPIDLEVISEPGAVDEAMRDGLRIEAAAWKGKQGTAMLSDPVVADFYVRLAKREAEAGQLRLTFLRVGGKRISFNYLLEQKKRLYAVKIGYDPAYQAYSPGNMLLNLILQDAFSRGIEEYDLLGGADPWKFEWTKDKREHRWLFLFKNRLRPRALHYLKFGVVPVVKKVYETTNHRKLRPVPGT